MNPLHVLRRHMHLDREPAVPIPAAASAYHSLGQHAVTVALGSAVGRALLRKNTDAVLFGRIHEARCDLAAETGFVFPGLHLTDDHTLAASEYTVLIRDRVVARGTLAAEGFLALAAPDILDRLDGVEATDPVYGLRATWIEAESVPAAQAIGAKCFEPLSVLLSHVNQAVRDHAEELFGREECMELLASLAERQPGLLSRVGTELLPISVVHRVWKLLMREHIWPNDPIGLIELLLDELERDPAVALMVRRSTTDEQNHAELRAVLAELHDVARLAEHARKLLVPRMLRTGERTRPKRYLTFTPEQLRQIRAETPPDALSRVQLAQALLDIESDRRQRRVHFIRCASSDRRIIAEFLRERSCHVPVYASDEIPNDVATVHHGVIGSNTMPFEAGEHVFRERP